MSIVIQDKQAFSVSRRELTDEGYMRAPVIAARTGIQDYLSSELGMEGPVRLVKVYRPPEEVFSPESLASYEDKTVTDDHPEAMVDAKSWSQVAHGHITTAGRQTGEHVEVDALFKSQDAIDAINGGKAEVSCGYTAEYDMTPGTTPDGQSYDAVQRNIRINHLALVDKGRAGSARVLDRKPEEAISMSHVTLDSGSTVEVADAATAKLIQNTVDGLRKQAEDAQAAVATADAKADKMEAERDEYKEEMEKEKEKTSDSAISARVQSVIDTKTTAQKMAGADFACDSCEPMAIMRAALTAKRPTVDWADKSEAYVVAAWDMAKESMEKEEEDEKEKEKATGDSYASLGKDMAGARHTNDAQAARDAARQAFLDKRYGKKEAK